MAISTDPRDRIHLVMGTDSRSPPAVDVVRYVAEHIGPRHQKIARDWGFDPRRVNYSRTEDHVHLGMQMADGTSCEVYLQKDGKLLATTNEPTLTEDALSSMGKAVIFMANLISERLARASGYEMQYSTLSLRLPPGRQLSVEEKEVFDQWKGREDIPIEEIEFKVNRPI